MTADITTQEKESGRSGMLPTLTYAFAVLTFCFALLSMILGNRAASLHTDSLKAEKEAVTSEAASIAEMETAVKTATAGLESVQQSLNAEKAAADRLRKQLSVVSSELETTRANLAKANQTITGLKSMQPAESTPAGESGKRVIVPVAPPSATSGTSTELPVQPEPQPTGESVSLPASTQPAGDAAVVTPSITRETLSGSPPELPAIAPAAD
jgi:prefoldin subunit 5